MLNHLGNDKPASYGSDNPSELIRMLRIETLQMRGKVGKDRNYHTGKTKWQTMEQVLNKDVTEHTDITVTERCKLFLSGTKNNESG